MMTPPASAGVLLSQTPINLSSFLPSRRSAFAVVFQLIRKLGSQWADPFQTQFHRVTDASTPAYQAIL